MRWWGWAIVGFIGTTVPLSMYKRYLYRRTPLGFGEGVPSGGAIDTVDCNHLVVLDHDAFAQWLGKVSGLIDTSGTDVAFTTRLMKEGIPGCPWPPPSGWRITFRGGDVGWDRFVEMIGEARD